MAIARTNLALRYRKGIRDMKYWEFYQRLVSSLPVGTVLRNPGRGTSEIVSYTDTQIVYKRGNSRIYVSIMDLYDAYERFRGKTVNSTGLRNYAPQVFDSTMGGHSCNCTFLFMVLRAIGTIARIEGEGKRGSPFRAVIPL